MNNLIIQLSCLDITNHPPGQQEEQSVRPNGKHLDKYRKVHPTMGDSLAGALWGFFVAKHDGDTLAIISSGEYEDTPMQQWEHVSVSVYRRKGLPTWGQMQWVKDLFWRPDETIVQFHPADSQYVNVAECLHLWKPPYPLELPPTFTLAPQVTGR